MQSRWYKLKPKAITLRKRGLSISRLESVLGIPRSTLSGWFRSIALTPTQKARLKKSRENGLINARKKAVFWHNAQKAHRLQTAENQARESLNRLKTSDKKNPGAILGFTVSRRGV